MAELGPFFAVGTGPAAGPGWRTVRELYDQPAALTGWVARVRARLGAGEPRVAASIAFQGYAARLWSVGLGALVLERGVPDLAPDTLLWRDEQGSLSLHLERPAVRHGERLEALLLRSVVDEHLGELCRAVRRAFRVSERLLWGNAASALTGAAATIDGGPAGRATSVTDRLLAQPPLHGTLLPRAPDGLRRRRSCCLFYRVPGGELCGDCALVHVPAVRARS